LLDLIAVGDVMLDVFAGAMPPGAVHGEVRVRGGGSALNAAVAAAGEGAAAAVVGRVGNDPAGTMVRAALEEAGVETRLAVDPALPTGTVVYTGNGVLADRGATAGLLPDDLPASLEAGAVLVSGYALLQDDTLAAARAAVERAQTAWVAVDVASAALIERLGPDEVLERARGGSVLLANEEEALALTGSEPREAAAALGTRFRLVCVKLGPLGALAAYEGELLEASAPQVLERGDPGAGDAFAAGLLVALARGESVAEALAAGCRAGTAAAGAGGRRPA
jgi:sugar/nucleoside kinase (ribokinase family)